MLHIRISLRVAANKLLSHGFLLVKLKSSLRKFYGCHHLISWGSCYPIFSFICMFILLAIVLSVLWYTDSDYPFDNFKFFLPMGAMFVNGSDDISYLHRCFLQNFDLFGQAVLQKIFRNRPTRNKNCLLQPGLMDPTKWAIFIENLPNKFPFIWPSSFRADF
jgi:hypothetical protein